MRRRSYRPFGMVGSLFEVAIGVYLLWGILSDDEEYGPVFTSVVGFLSVALIVAGAIGIRLSLRLKRHANGN